MVYQCNNEDFSCDWHDREQLSIPYCLLWTRTSGSGAGTASAVAAGAASERPACSARRRSRTRRCRPRCRRRRTRTRSRGSVRRARRALPAPGARRARSPSPRRAARWRARRRHPCRPAARARPHRARAFTSARALRALGMTMPGASCDASPIRRMDQFCTPVDTCILDTPSFVTSLIFRVTGTHCRVIVICIKFMKSICTKILDLIRKKNFTNQNIEQTHFCLNSGSYSY